MTNVSRAMLSLVPGLAAALWILTVAPDGVSLAHAEKAKATKTAAETSGGHAKPNACGCYKDAGGSCMCGRRGHCGCPGECEPRGCAEKQDKDIEKEIRAETKRAQDLERKQKLSSRSKSTTPSSDAAMPATPEPEHKTEARKPKPKREGR